MTKSFLMHPSKVLQIKRKQMDPKSMSDTWYIVIKRVCKLFLLSNQLLHFQNDLSTPEKLTKAVFGHSRKARDASSSLKEFLKMETMKLEELKKNRTTDFATPKYMFPAGEWNNNN